VKEYVLDANALLRYFQGLPGAEIVEKLVQRSLRLDAKLTMSAVNLGEVYYTLAKSIGVDRTKSYIQAITESVEIIPLDRESALAAAVLKFQYKLGYGDSIAALLAMSSNSTLVTADPEFARLGKKIKVISLPRHKA
jgi:tRNA(fMet)-specific endonuclease VapC